MPFTSLNLGKLEIFTSLYVNDVYIIFDCFDISGRYRVKIYRRGALTVTCPKATVDV